MSVGKNGNGRRFRSYVGTFAENTDFEEWATIAFPGMVIFVVIPLSDDCGNDENGGRFVGDMRCYEVILADPLPEGQFDAIATGYEDEVITVREATRRFWVECGFSGKQTKNGEDLIEALLQRQIRPGDLFPLPDEQLVSIFGAFANDPLSLIEGFKEAK